MTSPVFSLNIIDDISETSEPATVPVIWPEAGSRRIMPWPDVDASTCPELICIMSVIWESMPSDE